MAAGSTLLGYGFSCVSIVTVQEQALIGRVMTGPATECSCNCSVRLCTVHTQTEQGEESKSSGID